MAHNAQKISVYLMAILAALAVGMLAVAAGATDGILDEDAMQTPTAGGVGYVSETQQNPARVIRMPVERRVSAKKNQELPLSDKGGFIGADAAYSKPLANGGRIWVFGDTLIGNVKDGMRDASMLMFRNSIGFELAKGGMMYYWGRGEDNTKINPQGAFINKRPGEWYWPGDLVTAHGEVYVFLRRMKAKEGAAKDDIFGFEVVGIDLAVGRITDSNPRDWVFDYVALEQAGATDMLPGIAATFHDKYLYLLATERGAAEHPFYVGRISEKSLKAKHYQIEYYDDTSNSWGMSRSETPLIAQGAPEASLRFDTSRGKWRVVYSKQGLSPDVVMQESAEITHGWSEPNVIFTCPETGWSSNYLCYAGKEVEQEPGKFAVTYSVNSTDTKDLRDARIYVPRVVSLVLRDTTNTTLKEEGERGEAPPGDFTEPYLEGARPRDPGALVPISPQTDREGGVLPGYDSEGYATSPDNHVSDDGYMFDGAAPGQGALEDPKPDSW